MIRLFLLFVIGILLAVFAPRVFNPHADASAPTTAITPADKTYTLRARIVALPSPPKQFLELHHEAIPDFTNQKGEVIGMNEMVMPFPYLAPGVSLSDLKVGDAVEATMEMRFASKPRFLITRLVKLPADAKLNLGELKD